MCQRRRVNSNSSGANQTSLPGLPAGLPGLEQHFDRHQVPPAGREYVVQAVTGDPARRLASRGGNIVVRFASRKMGAIIQAASRTTHLPFVETCEYGPGTILFVCQPGDLYLTIVDARDRRRRIRHAPDYLVLDAEGFSLVQCRREKALQRDAARRNPQFVKEESIWRWPAAEAAAQELGLAYRVFSSGEVRTIWLRNWRYLYDYLNADCPDPALAKAVKEQLSEKGSMRIADLLDLPGLRSEVLWWTVANGKIHADLERERLFEVETSWVHSTPSRMLAARQQRHLADNAGMSANSCSAAAEPGSRVMWDGKRWTVLNRGVAVVALRCDSGDGEIVQIRSSDFEGLLRSGTIRGDGGEDEDIDAVAQRCKSFIQGASDKDLADALRRYRILQEAKGTRRLPPGVSRRSLSRFRAWYREGEERYGHGLAGCIRPRGRPAGTPGLGERQQEVLDEFVCAFVSDPNAGTMAAAYARLVDRCKGLGVDPPPSRDTFRRAIKRRPLPELVRAREGARAEYQVLGPVPREGNASAAETDRAFQSAHIDHTQVDVELVSERTGALLGRPWLTLLLDVRTRMLLAWSLCFHSPDQATLSSVLFDCFQRHRRAPDVLIVDQGAEFQSNAFEIALALIGVHKWERPAAKSRFGSDVERMFHTINKSVIHELQGNTKLYRRGRTLSSTHDPKRRAVWTLARLHEVLEEWLFCVYPDLIHDALGTTPRAVFDRDLARSGVRNLRKVEADEKLRILLGSAPEQPTRKVDPVRGITVAHLRYWHKTFAAGDVAGSSVEVRLDPADCGVVFARVRGVWETCRLVDGDADLCGRSWKAVELAVKELRAQRQTGAEGRKENAETIGRFLRKVDALGQGELARRNERDAEDRSISPLQSTERALPKPHPSENTPADSSPAVSPGDDTTFNTTPLELASDNDDALEGLAS